MFEDIPLEIVEKILLYLSVKDILSVFSAFNKQYSILSSYFWKNICIEEDFCRSYKSQEWYKSFQSGVNKKLGYYVQLSDVPPGTLEHVYLRSLVTCNANKSENTYNIYYMDDKNQFHLNQQIIGAAIKYKEDFIIIQKEENILIFMYNSESKEYEHYKSINEHIDNVFGMSVQYCATYHNQEKCFILHKYSDNTLLRVVLPSDVKFVIERILHLENIAISTLSYTEGYKIKVYDINTQTWILDLVCFGSTGLTNDPNIWVGSNFIACCDVSYRLRGIYFGPFKVWNKKGKTLFVIDIEPSTKHYLRCFFKEEHVLLTTSDNTIKVFNNLGHYISTFCTSTSFLDIKMGSGHLLFILLEEQECIEIYDWNMCVNLYSIKLNKQFSKSLYSDFLYCPINYERNEYEIVRFY